MGEISSIRFLFKGEPIMARKTKTINVSGMSISDIMNIDIDTFNKMNERELRAVTSRLVSASNKRIRRLEKYGIKSPAYQSLGTDTRFSTRLPKGTDARQRVNKLRQEFSSARSFLGMKTSTISGYKEYEKNIREEIESATGRKLGKGQVSQVYNLLHKAQERGIIPVNSTGKKGGSIGSLQAREIIVEMLNDDTLQEDDYFQKLQDEYERYEMNPEDYEYEIEDETTEIDI